MSGGVDLHSHSRYSDGTLTPTELVRHARDCGVEVLALTDHDTTAGIPEAEAAARQADITLIPGVEISVTWERRVIHIVGLAVDVRCAGLQQGLSDLAERRRDRAQLIAAKLEKCGISAALAAAGRYAGDGVIGRNHFARLLVERGYAPDAQRAFRRYLGRSGSCYVAGEWAALAEAVAWIRAAGGEAVVAHPARYGMTRGVMRRFLQEFRAAGGCGIEVISGSHAAEQARSMAAYAREFGLCASAGSDFHSPENTWTVPGRLGPLPPGCEPIWSRWIGPGSARVAGMA